MVLAGVFCRVFYPLVSDDPKITRGSYLIDGFAKRLTREAKIPSHELRDTSGERGIPKSLICLRVWRWNE